MRDMKLKKSIDGAVRFLDEGGSVARSFKESLEAGGVITEDLLIVAGAVTALLGCGLTREALCLLIQARCKNQRNGRPQPVSLISDVLDAMANLDHFIEAPKKKETVK